MRDPHSMDMPFCASQSVGERSEQEDSYGICYEDLSGVREYPKCYVLADGMGGHVGGSIASQTAVDAVKLGLSGRETIDGVALRDSLALANESIAQCLEVNPDLEGMGTTLIVASILDGRLIWMSVGDSPLFGVDANFNVSRLNEDHSMRPVLDSLVADGILNTDSQEYASKSNQLRSAVLGEEIELYEINNSGVALQDWRYFVMASDGIETLSEEEIGRCFQRNQLLGIDEITIALVDAIDHKRKLKQDNTTLIVLESHKLYD